MALIVACGIAAATEYRAGPSDYRAYLPKLLPGDTLTLAPGDYPGGLPVHRLAGLPGKPIVIEGPPAQPRARFIARSGANTVSILESAWVEIRNLELDGAGLSVAGVRGEGHGKWAHHITLEGLFIHGHNAAQDAVGISIFCTAWGWTIRDNIIVGAGTGMYLGGSRGDTPFIAGVIEGNLIVDSIGYNLEIKHQRGRPSIEDMPEGRSVTIIRNNVFSKSANSATGSMARPNLLVGHFPVSGPGSEDVYAIYGNFFYQNPTERLFQGEGNIAFYSNVLINNFGDALAIQPHNHLPRQIDIFHNTVLAAKSGISVRGGDPAYLQRVTGNAVFAGVPLTGGKQQGNITGQLVQASDYLKDPFATIGKLDLSPKPGQLATDPFKNLLPAHVPDVSLDFDHGAYTSPMAGAYARSGARWRLRVGPKQ